jgi:N-acetylglucosaminyldiphosphoundecaprenol N-acetyl-beta-D-mannosaminyltransferase
MAPLAEPSSAGATDRSARRRRVRLGRLWIDALTFAEAEDELERLVEARRGGSVFTPNVDHLVTAEDDADFRAAYEAASLSLVDGQPLLWAARFLGTPLPEKISGSDLVWPVMQRAARRGWRVYLLGGAPGVAAAAAERLERELGVRIVGVDSPIVEVAPPDPIGEAAADRIRAAGADVVLVALGAPKQERWIHRSAGRLGPAVALGIGATLDFIAGRVRRSPAWMSRAGLEWLHRLARDPRRLARRYLVKDPRALAILVRTARAPRAERSREVGA